MTNRLPEAHRFWIAVLVIGGYMLFGALCIFVPRPDNSTIFINTVLATMGPLVGWVVKALFEGHGPTGEKDDPVNVDEVKR